MLYSVPSPFPSRTHGGEGFPPAGCVVQGQVKSIRHIEALCVQYVLELAVQTIKEEWSRAHISGSSFSSLHVVVSFAAST